MCVAASILVQGLLLHIMYNMTPGFIEFTSFIMTSFRIALAQINTHVGDLNGNTAKIIEIALQAKAQYSADLVIFPELVLTGYPPEDLLFREGFVQRCPQYLHDIASQTSGIAVLLGYPRQADDGRLFNAAAWLADGELQYTYDKQVLPNYGVFDEKRYFTSGQQTQLIASPVGLAGITICEDIWQAEPVKQAVDAGAQWILNINASPFHIEKAEQRRLTVAKRCRANKVPVFYVNLCGGQDELVFDGASMVIDAEGKQVYQAPAFTEHLAVVELQANGGLKALTEQQAYPDQLAAAYQALVLAVQDYVHKNGFNGVVIGLSGGVDSALTLAIAVDALGADNVEAVMMPSRYTSQMSLDDAAEIANNFAVNYEQISIEPAFETLLASLQAVLQHYPADTTEENIQARCRGLMLMAISNKKRRLVLATGNKSEMAVGYATLYGDMAGGYAPLKDVDKTLVYALCHYRNRDQEMIPLRIIERPPSAELAPDQKDSDSLPPYDILDQILSLYLEEEKSIDSIIAQGFDAAVVQDVIRKVNMNEYKRRQAAPGVKITKRAFGRERRYPITCKY